MYTTIACAVRVGNIPYDAKEEDLVELFREAGPVVSFQLDYDADTGRPKGHGHCKFVDAATAQLAVRVLNGREFKGRTLHVEITKVMKRVRNEDEDEDDAATGKLRYCTFTELVGILKVLGVPDTDTGFQFLDHSSCIRRIGQILDRRASKKPRIDAMLAELKELTPEDLSLLPDDVRDAVTKAAAAVAGRGK